MATSQNRVNDPASNAPRESQRMKGDLEITGPLKVGRMLSRWPYSGPRGKQDRNMNEEQIERFRQIVQEISTDEKVTFDEAFAIASNYLAYWVSEMPKGRKASGGSGGSGGAIS